MPFLVLKRLKLLALLAGLRAYNLFLRLRPAGPHSCAGSVELDEIRERSRTPTDFSDHLETLFSEALSAAPHLIVELGTRGGESTFVLERVARLAGSRLVSVDLQDCSRISSLPGWQFVQADDIEFGRRFQAWCRSSNLPGVIDVLFIDTSHLFEHTLQEIATWFPHLSATATVIFHDTHLRYFFRHRDGSLGTSGWDNQRGVIRALEAFFGCALNERREFATARHGWLIRHWPFCNGLTLLRKMPLPG